MVYLHICPHAGTTGGSCFLCGNTRARDPAVPFHPSPLKGYLKREVRMRVHQLLGGRVNPSCFPD